MTTKECFTCGKRMLKVPKRSYKFLCLHCGSWEDRTTRGQYNGNVKKKFVDLIQSSRGNT